MSTYTDQLARLEASYTPRPYITNDEYRKQKAALTRAVNTGDPRKVLATVERALDDWSGKVWPDDWNRWRNALEDASDAARRTGDHELAHELHAASIILFP